MKSILIVIYAHYVKLILEGKKTVEVRKNKNLANAIKKLIAEQGGCWIYIYVAKEGKKPYDGLVPYENKKGYCLVNKSMFPYDEYEEQGYRLLNGKVVARFWCDKVEDITWRFNGNEDIYSNDEDTLLEKSCLSHYELHNYLQRQLGYAIHISKLEVFDEPKRVDTFFRFNRTFENRPKHCDPAKTKLHCCYGCKYNFLERKHGFGSIGCDYMRLREAPQNYCYIESEK